jgi:primosomal protein N' (replication factor Y)
VLLATADAPAPDSGQLRHALRILDREPLLPKDVLALARWASTYYQHPIGEVVHSGLPRALREGRPTPADAWRLTRRGKGLPGGAPARAPRQAQALDLLREAAALTDTQLAEAGVSRPVLRELAKKDLIERCPAPVAPISAEQRESGPPLTAEQETALATLRPQRGYHCALLEGVTGSGKTEVYLRLIADCLARGEQALLLVPEIGLTPQTVRRFAARFTTPLAVLHSGLSDGERLRAWTAAARGTAGIIIGTRSAAFTPLARPGLIIVDEEHDGSYKQQDGFRYSARDLAVKRAQLIDRPVLLGSATPSLETLRNALHGRYAHLALHARTGGGELPSIERLDLRGAPLTAGVSPALLTSLRECVDQRGEQALVFLNRRGFAPALLCHDCGWVAGCAHCDARQTVHLRRRQLRCHHCGARNALPDACPACGGRLLTRGLGTEQAEEFLAAQLSCPVHRIDSDALQGRDAAAALSDLAAREEAAVLLGTQMLTKGHHFPRVQLVCILDADALLYSADFRGAERLAQLIVQVAGRAGRERSGGRVLLQTHHPDHPLFAALAASGYAAVAREMLAQRQQAGLPPLGQLSLLRCDCREERDGELFLGALRRAVEGALPRDTRLIGPLPSTMPRRAGRFRWQLWALSASRRAAQAAAAQLVAAAEALPRRGGLNWFIDVDAQDVL